MRTRLSAGLSWDDLNAEVGRFHRFLEDAGIVAGDRVAGILPNMPESIVSALGTAAIGAVWSSCSPNQLTAEAEAAQSLGTGHATTSCAHLNWTSADFSLYYTSL